MSATVEKNSAPGESVRVELPVKGMTCVACARLIERKLSKTEGVSAASVNFATGRATVEYDAALTGVGDLRGRIEELGYRAGQPATGDRLADVGREELERNAERRDLSRRFALAAILSLPLLVIAMSHGAIPFFDVPWINWLQLALAAPVVLYCGAPFFRGAWGGVPNGPAHMNNLIANGH